MWPHSDVAPCLDGVCLPGCQRPIGPSRGKAKVCYYSGWYYCHSCHQDNSFLIPARLLHNWDTSKHKVAPHALTHSPGVSLHKYRTR